jgi:cytochrome c oxidase subunit III
VNFFRELTKKPWLTNQDLGADLQVGGAYFLPAAKVGLRVFLGVATVVFTLLIIAYADRMGQPYWRPLPEPGLLWVNTALLILSSVALQWSRINARQGRLDELKYGLYAGGGLSAAFIAGQLLAWQQLADLGYFAATNPANAFFYLLTALHGLHIVGGFVAWWRSVARVWRGAEVVDLRLGVELCAVYWHYLLLVWLVLFALLSLT